mgnify:CR=1 FL=1
MDDKGFINQAPIEEEVTVGLQEQCFFMVAIIYGGISTHARRAHGCTIALLGVAGAKRKDVVAHDDIKTLQDFL